MFHAYSPSHLVVLAIFAAGTVVLLLAGPACGGPLGEPVAWPLAVGNLVLGTLSTVVGLLPFDVARSFPSTSAASPGS